jgi:prepilin-type processing-associated H-X9-DG protein
LKEVNLIMADDVGDEVSGDVVGREGISDGPLGQRAALVTLLGLGMLCCLVSFFWPTLLSTEHGDRNMRCQNRLKRIGIGMILYSNDYKFFPHMAGATEHNNRRQISDVYRTLVQGQYIDLMDLEVFVCPNSDDFAAKYSTDTRDRASAAPTWDWRGRTRTGQWAIQDSSKISVFSNSELSYTYRRSRLASSRARSDTMIAADKELKDSAGRGKQSLGFNVGFGDGHATFIPVEDAHAIDRLFKILRMRTNQNPY